MIALADVGAGRHAHAQAVARVLLDHAPIGARQPPALRLGQAQDVHDRAVALSEFGASGRRLEPPGQALEHRGLAGPGLADHAQHLAGPEVEADVEASDALAVARQPAHATAGASRRPRRRSQ